MYLKQTIVGSFSTRNNNKRTGKIGFLELTRMIAARWANVDDETRKYCKMMGAMELVKYKEDMESYNLYTEQLAGIGQIPEDMKERMLKKKRAQEKKEANKLAKDGNSASVSVGGAKKKQKRGGATAAKPAIMADSIGSNALAPMPSLPPPLPRASPLPIKLEFQDQTIVPSSNLDVDMEHFITSLVRSPGKPTSSKVITPERSPKKRRLFRDRPSAPSRTSSSASSAINEMIVPLKSGGTVDDHDHLDGIRMNFSGIDEAEIAREFAPAAVGGSSGAAAPPPAAAKTAEPSFDYWDALVESPL